jgi:uncharacterized membrane protein
MALIVAGGIALSWQSGEAGRGDWIGPAAIMGACLCWAIDNNLTRKVSASDALFIASAKGLVAGAVNLGLALVLGQALPAWPLAGMTMGVGLLGYGLSLVFFVRALRELGTSRTGAYFSTAPFVGAAVSIALLGEPTPPPFWIAAVLMGIGVWLHLTETHGHGHVHEALDHTHAHIHDEHHRPQHVVAEEQRQVEDDADHGGGDGGQRRGELEVVVGRFDQRAAGQDEDEGRQEGEPGDQRGRHRAGQKQAVRTEHRLDVAADEADKGHHHDQRPGRGFAQRQAVDHLGRRQPAVVADRPLIDIGQHRIGTAERSAVPPW